MSEPKTLNLWGQVAPFKTDLYDYIEIEAYLDLGGLMRAIYLRGVADTEANHAPICSDHQRLAYDMGRAYEQANGEWLAVALRLVMERPRDQVGYVEVVKDLLDWIDGTASQALAAYATPDPDEPEDD